jgi:hypothetical protein
MKIICLVLVLVSFEAQSDCYQNLLQGSLDSTHRKVNLEEIDSNLSALDERSTYKLVSTLLDYLGCDGDESLVTDIRCTKELGLGLNTCIAHVRYGFFYLNPDYLQNVHLILIIGISIPDIEPLY